MTTPTLDELFIKIRHGFDPDTARETLEKAMSSKPSNPVNPKDKVGVSKWRQFFCVPQRVLWEVGVAMLEGALKYGRFNYRVTGVHASIYIDAAKGHISAWEEGQDLDPDTGLSHITKAIASLVALRDGMLQGNFVDDRGPRHASMDVHTAALQDIVVKMFEENPEPKEPFTGNTILQGGYDIAVGPDVTVNWVNLEANMVSPAPLVIDPEAFLGTSHDEVTTKINADVDQARGLYDKFIVTRTDGKSAKGEKHDGCEYFVLDMDHDKHARAAIEAYVRSLHIHRDYPDLEADLRKRYL